jgi:hypothetical protein
VNLMKTRRGTPDTAWAAPAGARPVARVPAGAAFASTLPVR